MQTLSPADDLRFNLGEVTIEAILGTNRLVERQSIGSEDLIGEHRGEWCCVPQVLDSLAVVLVAAAERAGHRE